MTKFELTHTSLRPSPLGDATLVTHVLRDEARTPGVQIRVYGWKLDGCNRGGATVELIHRDATAYIDSSFHYLGLVSEDDAAIRYLASLYDLWHKEPVAS